MREAAFVKQNKDKWLRFESLLHNREQISPDELSSLYMEVTDHLSYAQTFYPESKTLVYLNHLSSQSHQLIYKTKRESSKRFITFFTQEFPLLFYGYQRQLLIAFLSFTLFAIIGAYSAAKDGNFARLILTDNYVNTTLNNIENGEPMSIYGSSKEIGSFIGITIHNIKVALYTFMMGILFGIGTLLYMMYNGVMVGVFQYFFYERGLFWESARTIWIHGTIEISVIIIAGCAGMVVGNSILFPKTYTRLASFKRGMKNGLKIVVSTVPFFIVAGFLEGFVTRHTEMPDWLAIFIISSSMALILFYYVFYPRRVYKRKEKETTQLPQLP